VQNNDARGIYDLGTGHSLKVGWKDS